MKLLNRKEGGLINSRRGLYPRLRFKGEWKGDVFYSFRFFEYFIELITVLVIIMTGKEGDNFI